MTGAERAAAAILRELRGLPVAEVFDRIEGLAMKGYITRETCRIVMDDYERRRRELADVERLPPWRDDTSGDVTVYATGWTG